VPPSPGPYVLLLRSVTTAEKKDIRPGIARKRGGREEV